MKDERRRATIERYYGAFRTRDIDAARAALTEDFEFVSAFGEFRGREPMLEAIWPSVGAAWAAGIRIFEHGDECVVLYHHETAAEAERPPMSMAEHLTFAGDRISKIEVFAGRPLPARGPMENEVQAGE